jgi:G3E family GTPase
MNRKVPLYIVTGFLGSGKTTLINSMLAGSGEKRIGLIVNDFGPICVDASLLGRSSEGMRGTRLQIKELKNGQLFCSCLVGSFIDAATSLADSDLDALWIEASGLAKPSPLLDTMAELGKRSGGSFDFRGMVCVVDASRFSLLASVVNAIPEQIAYSRFVLVNKTDLVSESELKRVIESIRSINSECKIISATHAAIPLRAFENDTSEALIKPGDPAYSGWGENGRPIAFSLSGDVPVNEEGLGAYLTEIAPLCFRIKGFVDTDRGPRFVDCVGTEVKIRTAPPKVAMTGLVVISAAGNSLQSSAQSHWDDLKERSRGSRPLKSGQYLHDKPSASTR